MTPVALAVTRLAREDGGRVTAVLASHFGDLDLADESVQDALVEAVETWPTNGVPANPAGWLMTVARRKGIDRLRRTASTARRTTAAGRDLLERDEPADGRSLGRDLVREEGDVRDEHLRLVLLCCHPALHRDAQVALTLRLVGGLTTTEIAAAFLVPEPTITQRIVRAKRKIRDAAIPLTIPAALDERVDALLTVLYLVFNEGYLARASDLVVRVDLADEAIRLTQLVRTLLPDSAEVAGLLALMLFQRSRFITRVDEDGELVRLEDQDRTQWDGAMIEEANGVLGPAMAAHRPGVHQLQAVIAGLHANARTAEDTDWSLVATAYAQLATLTDSPVVRLNRAVAVGMADGPLAGLALLEGIEGLDGYHLLHASRGDLLERAGRSDEARAAFAHAATLTDNPAERRLLERRSG
ncbi:MAG: sigE 2 [Nocardioidaceae bacterium]|nr:sigE 2 [Nocardioidaceae bacterium]